MLDRKDFRSVYAPATRQNHKAAAGAFCFLLSNEWTPADGSYRIEVEASDTRGNRAIGRLALRIEHGQVRA
jgi:hypothetical protein